MTAELEDLVTAPRTTKTPSAWRNPAAWQALLLSDDPGISFDNESWTTTGSGTTGQPSIVNCDLGTQFIINGAELSGTNGGVLSDLHSLALNGLNGVTVTSVNGVTVAGGSLTNVYGMAGQNRVTTERAIPAGYYLHDVGPLNSVALAKRVLCVFVSSEAVSGRSSVGQEWANASTFGLAQDCAESAASTAMAEPAHKSVAYIVEELEDFRDLTPGWDGEEGAAPSPGAIEDAVSFVRAAGDLANRLEPTIHADGSIILETRNGRGSLRFKGDRQIIYALPGGAPGTAGFNGTDIPLKIKSALGASS
jgi:hypothetical protein